MNTIVIIFMLLIVPTMLFAFVWRSKRKHKAPLAPLETEVLLLKITPVGILNSGGQQVKLLVQVFPEKGRNFVREIAATLSPNEIDDLKEGNKIKMKWTGNDAEHMKPVHPAIR